MFCKNVIDSPQHEKKNPTDNCKFLLSYKCCLYSMLINMQVHKKKEIKRFI